MEQLINDIEAAALLGVSPEFLRRDRCIASRGHGVPFIQVGRWVRYSPSKLQEWLAGQVRNDPGASQEPQTPASRTPTPAYSGKKRGRPRKLGNGQ
jgi:hypothetical protein